MVSAAELRPAPRRTHRRGTERSGLDSLDLHRREIVPKIKPHEKLNAEYHIVITSLYSVLPHKIGRGNFFFPVLSVVESVPSTRFLM